MFGVVKRCLLCRGQLDADPPMPQAFTFGPISPLCERDYRMLLDGEITPDKVAALVESRLHYDAAFVARVKTAVGLAAPVVRERKPELDYAHALTVDDLVRTHTEFARPGNPLPREEMLRRISHIRRDPTPMFGGEQ